MADAEITKYLAKLLREGTQKGAWEVEDEHWTAVIMFYSFRGGCDEAIMGAQRQEDVPDKLFAVVITSYSIHYTKLYDVGIVDVPVVDTTGLKGDIGGDDSYNFV